MAKLFLRLWIDRGRMPDEAVTQFLIMETERIIETALKEGRVA